VKESTWKECLETGSALEVSSDVPKARSLLETSLGRNEYLKESGIKETSANFIFEGYYTSVLEMLHALLLLHGYKVKNHICLGHYIRDVLKRDDLFRIFDDCRYKRNSLIYYGKRMDLGTARSSTNQCIKFMAEIKNILDDKLAMR